MLQNASIKTKLAPILILPLLSLGVLAGMRVGDNLTRGRQADRMHDTPRPSTTCSTSTTRPPGCAATPRT